MKRDRFILILLWALVIGVAAMIYAFSAMDGPSSMQTSDGLVYFVMRLFHPDFNSLSVVQQHLIYKRLVYFVRKMAHFSEFALLGVSLRMLFQALRARRPGLAAWGAGTLYACSDEVHQYFVGSRSAMIQDVGIDSAGVLFGVLAVALVIHLYRRARAKRTAV